MKLILAYSVLSAAGICLAGMAGLTLYAGYQNGVLQTLLLVAGLGLIAIVLMLVLSWAAETVAKSKKRPTSSWRTDW